MQVKQIEIKTYRFHYVHETLFYTSVYFHEIKIKLRSLKSSGHVNEKGNGPYRGFSDPKHLEKNYCNFAIFNRVVDTKTSIIQMGPNILNVG